MRILRAVVVTALLVVLIAGASRTVEAEEPPQGSVWFDEDRVAVSPAAPIAQDGTVSRTRTAGLDATATATVTELVGEQDLAIGRFGQRTVVVGRGTGAVVESFDGRRVVADPVEVAIRRPLDEPSDRPWVEWLGAVHDADGAVLSQVTMSFAPQPDGTYRAAGSVTTNDGVVMISHLDGDIYRLDLLDPSLSGDEGDDVAGSLAGAGAGESSADGEVGPASHGSHPHIDVIVAFGNGNPSNIRDQISARIADANQAMASSGVLLRINLMAIPQVAYTQDPNMNTDITRLEAGTGVLAELHNLRANMGADLVGLVVPKVTTACGVANDIPRPGGESAVAWQVTAQACFGTHTLAHEFGHLLGGDHNPENQFDPPYAYSRGHYVNGVARTVMSYVNPCSSGCARTLQFSSPAVDFIGRPGVRSGVTNTRDNSLSLNNLDN